MSLLYYNKDTSEMHEIQVDKNYIYQAQSYWFNVKQQVNYEPEIKLGVAPRANGNVIIAIILNIVERDTQMARGRILSRQIAIDIKFNKLTISQQWLFMRLLPFTDDYGRVNGNLEELHLQMLPP